MSVPGGYISTLMTVHFRFFFRSLVHKSWRRDMEKTSEICSQTMRWINKLFSSFYLTFYICYYFSSSKSSATSMFKPQIHALDRQ